MRERFVASVMCVTAGSSNDPAYWRSCSSVRLGELRPQWGRLLVVHPPLEGRNVFLHIDGPHPLLVHDHRGRTANVQTLQIACRTAARIADQVAVRVHYYDVAARDEPRPLQHRLEASPSSVVGVEAFQRVGDAAGAGLVGVGLESLSLPVGGEADVGADACQCQGQH